MHDQTRKLTVGQRGELGRQLQERIAEMRKEIAEALHPAGSASPAMGLANHREDTDDQPVADLQTSVEVAAVERDVRELKALEAALQRVDTPEYGVCAQCQAAIPFARLRAEPAAVHCMACATAQERTQGGRAPHTL